MVLTSECPNSSCTSFGAAPFESRLLSLNEKLNSENRADAEVVAWKFKYEKAKQEKRYAQTHQKTVEVAAEKKVPYEKCENCDRTAYQKAKEKCDSRKPQLVTFFSTLGKGIVSLIQEFITGADSFGQLSNGISNSIVSGIVYWLIAAIVMGILFIITGFLIIGIGYQVGKIYRKYCWDILSIMVAIMSTAIVIYFGEWIKSVIPLNLIVLLLLVQMVYIGIRCYVKDWREERGYY